MKRAGLVASALLMLTVGCSMGSCSGGGHGASPVASPGDLLDLRGTGNETTAKFTAPANWALGWAYDCRGALTQNGVVPSGSHCTFLIGVKTPDGRDSAQNHGMTQVDVEGQGVLIYHTAGTFYLTISLCCASGSWIVRVSPVPDG